MSLNVEKNWMKSSHLISDSRQNLIHFTHVLPPILPSSLHHSFLNNLWNFWEQVKSFIFWEILWLKFHPSHSVSTKPHLLISFSIFSWYVLENKLRSSLILHSSYPHSSIFFHCFFFYFCKCWRILADISSSQPHFQLTSPTHNFGWCTIYPPPLTPPIHTSSPFSISPIIGS